MNSNSKLLLDKLSEVCGNIPGTLLKKLEILYEMRKNFNINEAQFINSIKILINKTKYKIDGELLGFKDLICKNILKIFEEKKYDEENIFNLFLTNDNIIFNKLLYFSYIIGKVTNIYILVILFSILTEPVLDTINLLGITDIKDNKFFIFLLNRNELSKLENEKNKTEMDFKQFIQYKNEDYINYIYSDDKKSKDPINNITENNNINNENINNIRNNNINNENINDIRNNNNINNENINDIRNNNNINNENINDIINNNNVNNENINNIISNNNINNDNINNIISNNNINNENINNIINNDNINNININIETSNNNIIINNNINIDIKDDERTNRIKELINKSLSLNYKDELQEKSFLKSNYKKFEEIKDKANLTDIFIDSYNSKNGNKLYLFSPISLMLNNIKNIFEKNDFEMFNDDNNYIEMFGSFLEEVIEKLNLYINEGKEKDYIIKNKIKFGCYKNHYYLCCRLRDEFKQKYFEKKQMNENIIINNNNINEDIKNILVVKIKKDEKNTFDEKRDIKNAKNENITTYSAIKTAFKNYRNLLSFNFESEVNKFIFNENNCENLQNIIFFFNLKIPNIIKKKEIIFNSVRLSFNNYINTLYGFREIDICFKNKKKRIINKNEILSNNICYIYNEKQFKKKKIQEIDISLEENSIIFCEVKNSFPNIEKGHEKFTEIQVAQVIENDNSNNLTFNYIEQMDNLFKKSKLFYNFFINENILNKNESMHILYLYDESNIASWSSDYDTIKENLDIFIDSLYIPEEFKKTIFQVGYFDKAKNYQYNQNIIKLKDEEIQEKDKSLQEKNTALKSKDKALKEKDEALKEKDEALIEKENENEKLKQLLKKHNIDYGS